MAKSEDTKDKVHQDATATMKAIQRRAIRKAYQRKARQKAAQATKATVNPISTTTSSVGFLVRHPFLLLGVVLMAFLCFFLFMACQSMAIVAGGSVTGVMGALTTYTTDHQVMKDVEGAYSAMESNLQNTIANIATVYPGYDEYHVTADPIGHNPHELASFLSAKYINYTDVDVTADLSTLYTMQYTLTLEESTDTRTRETEGEDGEEGGTEEYTVTILTVTLKNQGLELALLPLLTEEQIGYYHLYLDNLGGYPLLFGGGSTSNVPDTDISGVEFVNGQRLGDDQIIDFAKSQLGDFNDGGYKFWTWYGFGSYQPWCACFVSWCLNQAGYTEPVFAYCPYGINYFADNGRWATRGYGDIAPGDVIFFDWENDGISDHVGLVIGTDGSRVYTIEGNSGDAVHIRDYALNSNVIVGYGLI